MDRLNKYKYYLEVAKTVSKRSTCLRRRYGAVIVRNDEIISTGYNGAPRGTLNCIDIKDCTREKLNIPSGEQYEKCVAVHAEMNAIISAGRKLTVGTEIYLYGEDAKTGKEIIARPCLICDKIIRQAGINRVITSDKKISII